MRAMRAMRAGLGVGAGASVAEEAAKNDNLERIVGATVTAAIEPVLVGALLLRGSARRRRGARRRLRTGSGSGSPALVSTWLATSGPTPGRGEQGRSDLRTN
jgi:hypothetical protein